MNFKTHYAKWKKEPNKQAKNTLSNCISIKSKNRPNSFIWESISALLKAGAGSIQGGSDTRIYKN